MRALQVKQDHPDYLEPENFKTFVRQWGKLFLEMYYDDDITPYIHGKKTVVILAIIKQICNLKVYKHFKVN